MIRHYAILGPIGFWDIPEGTTLSLVAQGTYASFDESGWAGASDPGGPVAASVGFTVDVDASAEEIEKAMLDEAVAQGVIVGVPVTKKDILYTAPKVR